jgi:hypothetical protein
LSNLRWASNSRRRLENLRYISLLRIGIKGGTVAATAEMVFGLGYAAVRRWLLRLATQRDCWSRYWSASVGTTPIMKNFFERNDAQNALWMLVLAEAAQRYSIRLPLASPSL